MRKILFTKWNDPLVEEEEKRDDFDNDEEWNFAKRLITNKTKKNNNLLVTPIGMISVGSNLLSNQNKVWVGHTNFSLTPHDQNICTSVPGVEGWKCLTPYRFWLMIGWLFKDEEVHSNIKKSLCFEEKEEKLDNLELAALNFAFYAIIKLENGRKELIVGSSQKEIEEKLNKRQDFKLILKKSWK